MLKSDRFSCSQKIHLNQDPPVPPNMEVEETNVWTVLDILGTIAMDDFTLNRGSNPCSDKLLKKI